MYTVLYHQGKPVCLQTFQFLHTIGKKRRRNLMANIKENGLTSRVHGNVKRIPKHALSLQSTEYIVRFLHSYAEQHALLLPGWIPGYTRTDIQLLPSSESKRAVWRVYCEAAGVSTIHPVAYSTFLLYLEVTGTLNSCHEAAIRPVLAVSTEQYHNHTFC